MIEFKKYKMQKFESDTRGALQHLSGFMLLSFYAFKNIHNIPNISPKQSVNLKY